MDGNVYSDLLTVYLFAQLEFVDPCYNFGRGLVVAWMVLRARQIY